MSAGNGGDGTVDDEEVLDVEDTVGMPSKSGEEAASGTTAGVGALSLDGS